MHISEFAQRDFNSHAHVERDQSYLHRPLHEGNFNSHAHVERDKSRQPAARAGVDFNSHAHVERDAATALYFMRRLISTHTLTWSVTRFNTA